MNVLVVDDSGVMRKMISRELQKLGFLESELSYAEDGEKALAAASKFAYDLILMDWNMPNMLGIDALRAMRTKGIQTPIIMVTTESERGNVILAVQTGANNYIVKPFDETTFQDKITRTIPEMINEKRALLPGRQLTVNVTEGRIGLA